jgi:hypothetical protein
MLLVVISAVMDAQNKPPSPPAPPSPSAPPVRTTVEPPQPGRPEARPDPWARANVRFDILIVDEGGGVDPVRKAVTVLVADRSYGSSRSLVRGGPGDKSSDYSLNVDVGVWNNPIAIQDDGKVRARVTVEYKPLGGPDGKQVVNSMDGSAAALFESGKKLAITQTLDEVTQRRRSIEVTATVIK